MPDDKTKNEPADRMQVNVEEENEAQYWSQRYGITKEQLREVVNNVGPLVWDVERELRKKPLE